MLLRLRGEAEDETHHDAPLPEPFDEPMAEDAVPTDGIEADDGEERDGLLSSLPGPLIAAATFVPTFLAVFFGLSHVLGGAIPARTSEAPAPSVTAPLMSDARERTTPSPSETVRDPFVPPRLLDPPPTSLRDPRDLGAASDAAKAPRASPMDNALPSIAEPSPPLPELALPPAPPPVSDPPVRTARAPRAPDPPRQAQAAAPSPAPEPAAAEPRKTGRDWTPAAAFTDRDAANRLATSIQQQGYPVEVRQDRSSTRPWVVWIGAQPRSGDRRR